MSGQIDHKAMLRTGVASYCEIVIDRPVESVWEALSRYYEWNQAHEMSDRTTLRGEPGQVGELVQIMLKSSPGGVLYAETVRIRPLQVIAGLYRAGNRVWKVYDEAISFSRFSDMGVKELTGRTIFQWSVYEEFPASDHKPLVVGRDRGNEEMVAMKQRLEDYIAARR